jgi:hypothetical protein
VLGKISILMEGFTLERELLIIQILQVVPFIKVNIYSL